MIRLFLLLLMAADSAGELRRQGLARISSGQPKLATPFLEKACALEQAPGDSCYYLARNLHALGNFEAARKAFDLAIKAAPPALMPRLYRAVALNYSALGRSEEAERDFRKSLELGPATPDDVRVDLGAFLFRQGRTNEAAELLKLAVKANPDSARAFVDFVTGRAIQAELLRATFRRPARQDIDLSALPGHMPPLQS